MQMLLDWWYCCGLSVTLQTARAYHISYLPLRPSPSPLPGSNRSAALLQLSKTGKALADAEECIRLRPDWDKGYFRKAAALEALGRMEEVGGCCPGGRCAGDVEALCGWRGGGHGPCGCSPCWPACRGECRSGG